MVKTKVWLDCDPGHDDAMALILSAYSDKLELLGVSTVAGNQAVEKTTINALTVLYVSGVPDTVRVVAGASKPLHREPMFCPEIHGVSGLDHFHTLKIPSFSFSKRLLAQKKAIWVMQETILAQEEKVTLICTGSLTNAALLLTVFPEVKEKLHEIVLMGGCMGIGNTHPVAEFNIQVDPESADIVFKSGCKIVMVPLEVTHTVLVENNVMEKLQTMNTPFAKFILDLLLFFQTTYRDVFNFAHPPLHDPVAVAYVIDPSLFETKSMRVDVEYKSELSAGQTVCDVWGKSKLPKNVVVALKVDVPHFWELMLDALSKANDSSPLNKPQALQASVDV